MDGPIDVEHACAQLLRDPDIEIAEQGHRCRRARPTTRTRCKYLVEILKDENEYARRAAVEVLNELGTPQHVKHLLQSIKDDDWWVRSRAADALGKIGGPRVIDAALELIRDKDEDVRRAAIEILNQTKDERAVDFLIEATQGQGLVGAANAPSTRSPRSAARRRCRAHGAADTPTTRGRCRPWCARSASSATRRSIEPPGAAARAPAKEIRLEAIQALARLADERAPDGACAARVPGGTRRERPDRQHALRSRASEDIDSRFCERARSRLRGRDGCRRRAWPSLRARC